MKKIKKIEVKKDNKKSQNNNKEILPYWLKHPEVCKSIPLSDEERIELEELLKGFK